MPSTLRTPSPIAVKPVKCEDNAPDIYRLDPDGDITLVLTRYVTYVDEDEAMLDIKTISAAKRQEDDLVEEEVVFHVSSRHMILASPVFRAMLQRKFSESNTLQLTGSVEIPLPDDDPDAMLILLKIIHGHMRKVPLRVDLITLVQLAILIDKYDVHEVVELFSNFWFDNLKSTIPEKYTDDIPAWICICWVFDRPNEFRKTTRLALREGKQAVPSDELPIPQSVVEAINSKRQEVLHKLVTTLYGHIDDYTENEHCSFECDALMLGSLTKRLRALKIFPHRPDPPYAGLCFEEFDYRFRQGMYFPGAQRTSAYYYEHSKCAIRSLDTTLLKCEEKLSGLDMCDYK
ncbi:uncharacterized protein CIMG_01351 [Coccidioides immitis RS]|uniref:BTB domain-containing protein n=4 Tax=Coccidioides immitis TaxID=5501 RepID=J3KJ06_COCIM|nr:uncharacterized protein CIMG_01351 [Coccidioides immitis RS]KMP01294.1 hypothetical protein CIRG_01434 [Coccidioides immitis RMSCC 2394]KMU75419.1 hypothetical protein CISG_05054 [Coccidioides immitis RMSCC 3703]KMU83800.1 hypothetical protein CIHG_01584 [Coccidioides immitis H538.4]TPX25824.1 hypothetical protein DIZ76_011281 [Coccidioides immitis]EAS35997.3 hypothetical protein CIMG_01351 [Coccidioides immitis RS]